MEADHLRNTRRSDVGIPHQLGRVKRIGNLAGRERERFVRIPAEERLADEDVVVVEPVFERLIAAVGSLAGRKFESAEPILREFEFGAETEAEPPAALLSATRTAILLVAILMGSDGKRIELAVAVIVLIAETHIAVELEFAQGRGNLEAIGQIGAAFRFGAGLSDLRDFRLFLGFFP